MTRLSTCTTSASSSASVMSAADGDSRFIRGRCCAEMKKSVVDQIDIHIDSIGVI